MADTTLTRVDSVLQVAGAPDPRDGLTLGVAIASIDTLFESASDGANIGAGVINTALDREVATLVVVVLVVDTGQCSRDLGGRDSRNGSGADTLSGPDAAVVAQLTEGFLKVAPSVVEPEEMMSINAYTIQSSSTYETSTHSALPAQVLMQSSKSLESTAVRSLPP